MFYSLGRDLESWEQQKMQNRTGGVSPLLGVGAARHLCFKGLISLRNEPGPALPHALCCKIALLHFFRKAQ